MAYCTQADMQNAAGGAKRFLQLTDWDNNNAIDAQVITDAIAEADSRIDEAAAKLYTVPFNPVPEPIKRRSAEIALLITIRRRLGFDESHQKWWDELTSSKKGEEGWLLLLANGVVTPGTDPMPVKHSTMAVDSVDTKLPTDRDVSRDKLGGFW